MTTDARRSGGEGQDDATCWSKARYRSILRAAPAGIGVVVNRVIVEVNDHLCEMTGYSREELLGQSARVLYPTEEDYEYVGLEKYRQIASQGTGTVETHWLRKDGTILDVLLSSSPIDPSDLAVGVTFTAFDITERKRAEQELRTSEENYRRITDNMHDLVAELDAQGRFQFLTPSYRRVLGYDPKELLGESAFALLHPEDRERVIAVFEDGIRLRKDQQAEFRYRHADGHYIWFRSTGSFLFDASATFTGVVITSRDVTERKKAEDALLESEKRFSVFMNHLPAAAFIKDFDGLTLFANRYLSDLFGWEDAVGKTTAELLPPEIAEGMIADDRRVLTEGLTVIEESITDTAGTIRLFDTYKFPLVVGGSAPLLGGIAIDVTERKSAEKALRQANLVIENSPVVLFRWKAAEGWPVELVSRNVIQFGYTPEELLSGGVPYSALVYGEDLERVGREVQEYSDRGAAHFRQEYRLVTKEGEVRWVDDRTVIERDAGGRITHYQGIIIDITERKRAEEALLEKTKELDRFFNINIDLLCIADTDGNFRRLNVAWERILGYSLEELMSKPFLEFVHPDDLASTREAVGILASQREVMNFVNRYRCKDGSYRWIEWRSAPSGNVIYAAARDITDRIKAEEERIRLEVQMREVQKLESLGVLAGGIAHDFNNILMAILGNADLALLALSPTSPAWQNLQEINRASQRAADLCRQMLAYSGKGRFVVGRYDLSEIVKEMAQMLEISISKKASLRYSFARELPPVEADVTQLRQIIMNLITNASEALGEQSGVITIATGVMECDRGYLANSYLDDALRAGSYVYLEVSDTGAGMDVETRGRIFDPFFTTKFMGRGLGLAAVLGIVRSHMGTLKVYSEPGQGTSIKVLLPAVAWKPGDQVSIEEQAILTQTGGTVLLVDDDPYVRDVGLQMLERLRCRVVTAAHGREAVEIFQAQGSEIDCVILDLTMPEMGGEEAFRRLRHIRKDVRVILSSGYNEQDVTQRFVGKGLAGFIQKPYTVAKLREALARVQDS